VEDASLCTQLYLIPMGILAVRSHPLRMSLPLRQSTLGYGLAANLVHKVSRTAMTITAFSSTATMRKECSKRGRQPNPMLQTARVVQSPTLQKMRYRPVSVESETQWPTICLFSTSWLEQQGLPLKEGRLKQRQVPTNLRQGRSSRHLPHTCNGSGWE
jgi:hypothetical protein